jgi:PhzF family phenazine biosynthesis protein
MLIPRFQVDVFTQQPFSGNPAAVCPLSGWLDDRTLKRVAYENNLSATAFFVVQPGKIQPGAPQSGLYELRWFTPQSEIKLCGHATLASAYVLFNILRPELAAVRFQTRFSGELSVCRAAPRQENGEFFSMDFPANLAKTCPDPPHNLILGLGPGPLPSQVLEANETYIAVYDAESAIRNARPNLAQLRDLHPYAVAITAPGDEVDFVSRYFAPSYGVPEDPVTGSVHCTLAPYWAKRLHKTHLHARQLSERGGELWCEWSANRVIIEGAAVLTLQGSLEF